eukprot:m.13779 g.13779  ORF g.13779 m.13779 type:complete len:75 (+) comp4709_c0_seq1:2646-2870(+)
MKVIIVHFESLVDHTISSDSTTRLFKKSCSFDYHVLQNANRSPSIRSLNVARVKHHVTIIRKNLKEIFGCENIR